MKVRTGVVSKTRAMLIRRVSMFFTPSQTLIAIVGAAVIAMAMIVAVSFRPIMMKHTSV